MYDSTSGVDVGADSAVVAVPGHVDWETVAVELDDLPSDLVSRVGDGQPCVRLVEGGFRLRPAHDLYVDAVERALVVAGARLHRPLEGRVGLAVPAWWTQRAAAWTLSALNERGLGEVRVVNAAEAAVTAARAEGTALTGDVLVVDLGARSCSATVVATQGQRPTVVPGASAVHLEGGEALDRLVLHRIVASLDGLGVDLNRNDPDDVAAASAFLERCREVRHELSARSAITVTPTLAGSERRLRIVREEFEELVAPWRDEVVRIAVAAVTQSRRRVASVLLTGGLSRTPLIAQTLSAALDVEVFSVSEPDLLAARGAALAAGTTDAPASLWARSRARLARGWLRRPAARAIPSVGQRPLALPVGTSAPVLQEQSEVLIEQVPNAPIALGPAGSTEAGPAEPLVEEVQEAEERVEEPATSGDSTGDPRPDLTPDLEPAAEINEDRAARDEAVLDLVQAFVPSQRTSSDDRKADLAGMTLVGSHWVREPGPVFADRPATTVVPEAPAEPADLETPPVAGGRRRRRSGRRRLLGNDSEMTDLDQLFDQPDPADQDERAGDRASSGAR